MKVGDTVIWFGGTRYVGPGRQIAVVNGDIRTILELRGSQAIISRPGGGFYGWTDVANLRPRT